MRVLISIPNTGWISKHCVFSLLKLQQDKRYLTTIILPTHSPIDNNRNLIIIDFLKGGFDYLLIIDADNPPTKNPLDLIEYDKDVMIFPTPQWHLTKGALARGQYPIYWNCMDKVKGGWREHNKKEGLQEIDAGGTGCILIARRVLTKIKKPFERVWTEDGVVEKGSDFYFCEKAKEEGFKIFCHYDYPCMHFKEQELTEVIKAFGARDISATAQPNINTKEYWDKEWSKRKKRVYPYYKKIVSLTKDKKVLDFGCGRGDLMALLDNPYGIDISKKAIEIIQDQGMEGEVGSKPKGKWDAIVCTEVLEHLDNDKEMIEKFFKHTNTLIYAVPNNCLPPSVEPEHRRIYTKKYIKQITPNLKQIWEIGNYLLVLAHK